MRQQQFHFSTNLIVRTGICEKLRTPRWLELDGSVVQPFNFFPLLGIQHLHPVSNVPRSSRQGETIWQDPIPSGLSASRPSAPQPFLLRSIHRKNGVLQFVPCEDRSCSTVEVRDPDR